MFFVVLTIYFFSSFDIEDPLLYPFEVVDNALKNHYINSSKTSINKDKNTYKKCVYNQQEIN